MHLLGDVFTSEHGEAVTVLQLLTKFKMTLSEIDTYLNEYGNRLNSIEFLNVTQQQEIIILKSQVQTLQTNVSNLQLTVGDYLLRFTDLDIQLGVINGKITTNTTDISSLNSLVSSIQTSITNINNQLSTISSQIAGINTRVDITLSSISDINANIDVINATLSTQSAAITTLTTSVNDLTTLVNNLQNTCTTLTTDLNLLTSRVEYLETNDSWQNGQISALTTSTQLNTSNVSALNTLVGGLDGRVDVLEEFGNNSSDCLELDSLNSFELSTLNLPVNTFYNLWEYPSNVDTDKTLVNIQTSFAITSESTSMTINTPNGTFLVSGIVAGVTSPVTLNIDFMYKISNNLMSYYGICALYVSGKYPIIRVFSSSNNFPAKADKGFPLDNSHLAISFSSATAYLQPHVKITKYKIGV